MPDRSPPTLAVVVPATDDPPTLDLCLAALAGGTRPPDELIVQADPPGAGPAQARNLGARRAAAEVVVFVDADLVVHGDALARIAEAFAADPGLTAVFGAYDDRPAAPGAVSRFRNLLHHHVHASAAGPAETFWAGLGAVRREALLASGGFDADRYPRPAIEDIELGVRLRSAGGRVALDPRIRGTHLKQWTTGGMIRTDFAHRGLPWARLLLERPAATPSSRARRRRAAALNLAPRHLASAGACVVLVAAALARRRAPVAAALIAMAALNAPFYALLARRGGASLVLAGMPLHVLHHLTAVAAAAAAPALAAFDRRGRRRRPHD